MTSPVRVIHVSWAAGIGGVERLILDLLGPQMRDPALRPEVLFASGNDGDFGPEFSATGAPVRSLGLTSGVDVSPAKFRLAVRTIERCDVVHMHTFNALVAAAALRAERPVVFTVHGVLAWGREMRVSDRLNDALLRWFLNHRAAVVTYNSLTTEGVAKSRYGLERIRSEVIYNGVDLGRIATSGQGVDPKIASRIAGRFVIGTTTRFAAFKRIDRLVDAFGLFVRGNPDALLLLVGDGALRSELERRVASLGIAENTIFAGYKADVRAYQNAMSVCVFPSAGEPFGLVSVEALGLGKPVIVFSDGGGLVEVVQPNAAEDVIDSVEGLAKRLEHYAGNQGELQELAAARVKYARRFDIASTAERFRSIYLSLV